MSALIRRALPCCSLLCFLVFFFPLIPARKLDHSSDALAQKPHGAAKERHSERRRMVEEQIIARGIESGRVLQAVLVQTLKDIDN